MARSAEAKDPRRAKYHENHPMREDGVMPHDFDGDGFIEYMILQAMTEDGYWLSVIQGQAQAVDWEKNGTPIATANLTNDQKGWAKADHFDHYTHELSRWRKIPGKASKVAPAKLAFQIRDLVYRIACDCDEPKYVLWGHRWDLTPLHQCHKCGEVIVKPPRIYNNNFTATDDIQEEQHDDNRDDDVEHIDHAA